MNQENDKPRCLVVGSGPTGQAHLAAAAELIGIERCATYAPSRRHEAAIRQMGVNFLTDSLEQVVAKFSPSHAVVAVPVESLIQVAEDLISNGVKRILLEKPGSLSANAARRLLAQCKKSQARITLAYNRRYYSSVSQAQQKLESSGEPITSVLCEFTEWPQRVLGAKNLSPLAIARCVTLNSLHALDLAFFPVGLPNLGASTFVSSGSLPWHPSASIFSCAGITTSGALFSCYANWQGPGRFAVEWITASKRYIFKPLEQLIIWDHGSPTPQVPEPLEDSLDEQFKPGFMKQMKDFFSEAPSKYRVSLEHGIELIELANRIGKYPEE